MPMHATDYAKNIEIHMDILIIKLYIDTEFFFN